MTKTRKIWYGVWFFASTLLAIMLFSPELQNLFQDTHVFHNEEDEEEEIFMVELNSLKDITLSVDGIDVTYDDIKTMSQQELNGFLTLFVFKVKLSEQLIVITDEEMHMLQQKLLPDYYQKKKRP